MTVQYSAIGLKIEMTRDQGETICDGLLYATLNHTGISEDLMIKIKETREELCSAMNEATSRGWKI